MKKQSEKSGIREIILSSPLVIIIALLFLVSAVLVFISLLGLLRPGTSDTVRRAIASHGIYGDDTITVYFAVHIAARIVLLIFASVFSFGICLTLANHRSGKGSLRADKGLESMIWICNAVNKLVKPAGIAVGALFAYKLIRYLIYCFGRRYVNSMIFSFFATLFGELLLALIAVGVMYWIYRYSASLVDDLTAIEYSLITNKPSVYGISSITFFSLIASTAVTMAASFAVSYDYFAFAAFTAAALAQLFGTIFIRTLKTVYEEQAYKEYLSNGGLSGGKDGAARIS